MRGNKIIKAYLNARGHPGASTWQAELRYIHIIAYIPTFVYVSTCFRVSGSVANAKLFRRHNWVETEAQTDAFISLPPISATCPPATPTGVHFPFGNCNAKVHTQYTVHSISAKLTYEIAFWANNWIFGVICEMHLVANWMRTRCCSASSSKTCNMLQPKQQLPH